MPTAPCSRPSATSRRMRSSSAAVAGRSSQPIAYMRTVPCGTRYAALTAIPRPPCARSSRSR
ncbi:hypothetical protein STANM309S_01596 [Streptomyces tanashiensis]